MTVKEWSPKGASYCPPTLGRYAKLRYTAIEPLAHCYLRYATALLAAKDAILPLEEL
ncbi:hypothetical protein PCANC_00515 [Puccinia coronata f. sp. avenae]|uniref:Uncharacterized protein n=1 Tax=Puccinia coronata f. sp. avenae TaxID=200324 RepID=A0A2N5W7V0_9BASI|nr:hypothetical protein PCANC_00515 [Puccinia coronata f. sp. avenae]